jgi:cellulose synthase/poly-beta-1,6-N-acetylglucosamine synthase-like glycosyltransferase
MKSAPHVDLPVSYSVIIPVRNGARTLGRCLDALRAQTGAPMRPEVIVVDDASTDGTVEVAQAHGVRLLTLPRRQGPAAARNAGAAEAQGEVLLFLDADCEAAPDWCQEMLRPLSAPDVCAVYGAYRSRQKGWVARLGQAEFDERYARLALRQSIDFLATHAAAIRGNAFLQVGGFRTDLRGNEDVELAFRLSHRGYRIAFAPHAIVYHEHPDALPIYLRTKVSRGYWRTLAYAAHPMKAVADDYTPPWLKLQVAGMVAATLMLALSALHMAFCPLFLLMVCILVLTTLPFTLFVSRAHPDLVFLAPLFSLARSAALALGVIAGLVAVGTGKHRDTNT